MRIEFRLKHILRKHQLDRFGVFSHIADDEGISRKVVGGLYDNRRDGITFNQLQLVCQWLRDQGVNDVLPGALFGFSPSGLVAALSASGRVRIYLGEYFQPQATYIPRYWVSWADSEVASLFVRLLPDVQVDQIHVPGHAAPFGSETEVPSLQQVEPARRIFRDMREDASGATNILIGSQRANLLVELFVADLLGCDAFTEANGSLPFYLRREASAHALIPSCFGGTSPPPNCPDLGSHGIYFRNGTGWDFCPFQPDQEADAGVLIVRRVPGQDQTDLALFGYSAQATRAMGELLRRDPDKFWGSLEPLKGGIEARVFVCRLSMREPTEDTGPRVRPVLDKAEVYPLELKSRARAKRARKVR